MKVLITGATGFIGQRICEKLIEEGSDVVVLSRDAQRAKSEIGLPVEAYSWNPASELPPQAAFEGVTGVIHLAGESVAEGRWTKAKRKRILESRTRSTAHLVQAMKQYGKSIEAFVCASAIGYYSERGDELLDEKAARGEGFLADVCEAWEAEAAKADSFTRRVSIRIGMVLGHGGALQKLLPIFRLGLGGKIGNGKQWMSWIHVDDLAGLFIHSLRTEQLRGPVNGVAPHPVTNKDFTKSLASALGVPAFLPVPVLALRVAMGQMSELATKSQRVRAAKAVDSGYTYQYPTIDQAFAEICPSKKKSLKKSFA
ncbi:MAG: TIGR01777 family oxidoreductase [Bdellovibrionota bacterium]